jgi:hypothetical protein
VKGAVVVAMQTIAVAETERLQQAWQGYYRARRRVRQTKLVAGFDSIFRPPRLTRILCLPFYHVHRRDRGHGDHTSTHLIPFKVACWRRLEVKVGALLAFCPAISSVTDPHRAPHL